jgi:rhomboid-like protein
MATCMGIAVINMVVFILWRNPSIWKSFNRYMLMSVGHPIPFSVFGSMFSHQYPKHLLTNGFILFLAGPTVCEEIGRGNFIALFIISGIGGNIFSLYYNVLIKNFLSASLGMSSACYGIVAAYFLLDKRRLGTETFGFDYNGWFALIPLLLSELISWRKTPRLVKGDTGGGSDYANHVGGMIAGAILGLWLKWRKEGESRAWEEYDGLPVEIQEVEESASPVSVVKTDVQ